MSSRSSVDHARASLETSGRFPAGVLSPEISRSWERCISGGLDPTSRPDEVVIPFAEVKARREGRVLLRRLALAQMQLLHEQIAGSDFMVAFADADGIVLDTLSDHRFSESDAGRSIVPGSVWLEDGRGTNALGLALVEQAPIAIYGREHYFSCHGHLSCMAVPVFDPADRLVGLLDASSPNEARQQHTHALVRMAAAAVENGLIVHERTDVLLFALHPRAEYLDTLSAGLIALSPEGGVISLNRPARALLAGLDPDPGRLFEELFDARFGGVMDELHASGIARIRDRSGSMLYVVCRRFAARPGMGKAEPPARRGLPAASPVTNAPGFVCADPVLLQRMKGLPAATRNRIAVHIHGETGTGKELMARHIHSLTGRTGEFVAVNCGAVPETLFIAELFGHDRGAFTNARNDGAPGLLRLADKGTLFLDEVGDIPLAAQTALLRFLDTMEVRPIGGAKTVKLDVQIISATNRDLAKVVAAHQFRPDLYYRLSGFPIHLPPLRERADFDDIVHHLTAQQGQEAPVDEAVLDALRRQAWPGNIRELQNWVRRACLDDVMPDVPTDDGASLLSDACSHCSGTMLGRTKCRRIRETYLNTDMNVQMTARLLGVSRTTVYKHIDNGTHAQPPNLAILETPAHYDI
ncbi:MAG TPA: sigma-54-dependent Fis family transcriptional regulator [Ancylobacter sp.]